jgi:hypothetical protein
MTENEAIRELNNHFAYSDYKLQNTFIYQWESDFFCISSSGYAIEVEVKLSKSDFRADFKKSQKHKILSNYFNGKKFMCIPGSTSHYAYINGKLEHTQTETTQVAFLEPYAPNKFYYCCPENIILKTDIPDYAGLLYLIEKPFKVSDVEYRHVTVKEVKTAKFLHKNKLDLSKKLLSKYYWLCSNQRYEIRLLRDKINELNQFYCFHEEAIKKTANNEPVPYYEQDLFKDQILEP